MRFLVDFLDDKHEERFMEMVEKADIGGGDKHRTALFFIITGDDELTRKIEYLYNFETKTIKTNYAKKADFSTGTTALIKIAFNFFNERNAADLSLFDDLDFDSRELARKALKIRFPY